MADAEEKEVVTELEQRNLLGRLRERRQKIGADREPEQWDFPGQEGELVVQYRYVELEDSSRASADLAQVKVVARRNLLAACDTLIACCDEFFIKVPGEGLKSLSMDGTPIRYDDRLASALGFEAPTKGSIARSICRLAFNNDYALIRHAMAVARWLETGRKESDQQFVGE